MRGAVDTGLGLARGTTSIVSWKSGLTTDHHAVTGAWRRDGEAWKYVSSGYTGFGITFTTLYCLAR